jgi:RNA polymerase sigma-70 factor, ECF subfamily
MGLAARLAMGMHARSLGKSADSTGSRERGPVEQRQTEWDAATEEGLERSLIERARAGDRDAFEALVRLKVDAVYRSSLAILGNSADAQEATQDALVSMWRSLRSLRDPDRFDAWLGRIVTNACRSALRRRGRVREILLQPDTPELEPSVEDSTHLVIAADRFDRAFAQLPVEQRALLVGHHLDGRSIESLADELRVPAGTAKSRLFAARSALERALEDEA